MAKKHAMLSASGSAKWLSCPAALAMEALINEPDKPTEEADEGTAAHIVLEKALKENADLKPFVGLSILLDEDNTDARMVMGTQQMVDSVEIAIEYIDRLSARNSFYEERVDYSHIAPQGFGTADIILEVYEKIAASKRVNTLYVIDFKYGAGIKVDAFENSQGMLYALGALNSLDPLFDQNIERVVVVIIQPRMDHISEFEISVKDLLKWGEEIKPKAQQAFDIFEEAVNSCYGAMDSEYRVNFEKVITNLNSKNFNPTKKGCQWCQGRRLKRCKAHAQTGFSAAIEGFDDLTTEKKDDIKTVQVSSDTLKDPAFLDNKDLASIYFNMKLFLAFANDLDDEIRSRIKGGQTIPGLKLIPTENPRAWKDGTEAAIKAMRTAGLQKNEYLKWGIISPTEAEKVLKKVKPKDHNRRYKRLEAVAVHRPKGKEKIIEDINNPAEKTEEQFKIDADDFDLDLLG